MRSVIFLIFVVTVFSSQLTLAQTSSDQVRCPVITVTGSGQYFAKTAKQFRCYTSKKAAVRAGLVAAPNNAVVTVGAQTSGLLGDSTPTPTPTPGPDQTLTLSGKAGGASGVFVIRSLPAVVSYNYSGGATETFSLLLRDAPSGTVRAQVAYGRGIGNNAAVISKTGIYYFEVKAGQNMTWSLILTYR